MLLCNPKHNGFRTTNALISYFETRKKKRLFVLIIETLELLFIFNNFVIIVYLQDLEGIFDDIIVEQVLKYD